MDIILWILFGALVGWVASRIMKSDREQRAVLNVIVGIVGAVVGGWIMDFLGYSSGGDFNLYSFLVALLGACVLIFVVKAVRRS